MNAQLVRNVLSVAVLGFALAVGFQTTALGAAAPSSSCANDPYCYSCCQNEWQNCNAFCWDGWSDCQAAAWDAYSACDECQQNPTRQGCSIYSGVNCDNQLNAALAACNNEKSACESACDEEYDDCVEECPVPW